METTTENPTPTKRRLSKWTVGGVMLMVAAVAGGLYLDSRPSTPYAPPPTLAPKPAPVGVPLARFKALENHVTDLEASQAAMAQRLDEVSMAASAPAPVATVPAEASPEMQQELKNLRAELEALKSRPAAQESVHKDSLLVALYELEKAAQSGNPFSDALDALLKNPKLPDALHLKLQSLKAPAARGLATNHELTGLFDDAMDAYQSGAALTPAEGSSVWQQVKQNLSSLITVRKIGDENGTGDEAAIARANDAMAEEDITTALGEISQLGEETLAYFEDWLKQARRQQKALHTIDRAREMLEKIPAPDAAPTSAGNV